MAVTLLITATGLEAAPLKAALPWDPLPFQLGELYAHPARGYYLAHLGIAKVNTAAGLSLALHTLKPDRVIQFGIGGAFKASGLDLGEVIVATKDTHMDTGVGAGDTWQDMRAMGFPLVGSLYNTFPTDLELTRDIATSTGARLGPFGTSEAVTATAELAQTLHRRFKVAVESMEGAAAAQVCTALGIPFAEIRGISNFVGERDKSRWEIGTAVNRVNRSVLHLLGDIA